MLPEIVKKCHYKKYKGKVFINIKTKDLVRIKRLITFNKHSNHWKSGLNYCFTVLKRASESNYIHYYNINAIKGKDILNSLVCIDNLDKDIVTTLFE